MTNVNIQTEHIIAYLEGKLSKEDSLAFEKQMLDSPELRKEVGDLRFICDTSQMLYLQEKIDVDNHWNHAEKPVPTKDRSLFSLHGSHIAHSSLN